MRASRALVLQWLGAALLVRAVIDPESYATTLRFQAEDCKRLHISQMQAMDHQDFLKLLREPVIVTGALDAWPMPRNLTHFTRLFGHHLIQSRRTRTAGAMEEFTSFNERREEDAKRGGQVDETNSRHIPVAEYARNFHNDHIVLFSGEPGMSVPEKKLLRELEDFRPIPTFLKGRGRDSLFFSFGSGRQGVNTANHGFTWIALVSGMKRWHVAPHEYPMAQEPHCYEWPERVASHACTQNAGDVILLPTAWWHSTCNYGDETIGVGGQDSCDLGCEERVHSGERNDFCLDESRYEKCWSMS